MSVDSVVTYTSVHSEARSWSIPSEDPYKEAARQLLEQAPHSPEYVPDTIELEDHVPVYIPEPEHPKDLVPAKDEAPIPPLPPFFLSPRIRPPCTRAAMAQMRATAPSIYHSLLPSGTPPLLPIPLPTPSTSRRADIPEAETPPQKRLLLTTPRPSCEVGKSYDAAAARQPGPTMAHRVDYSLVDTIETRFRDTERRMMTALKMVNMRVSYQVDVRSRESSEFYSRHHDAQKDLEALTKEFAQDTKELLLQGGAAKASSTNTVNTASTPVSIASPYGGLSFTDITNTNQDDSKIPALEDIYLNPTVSWRSKSAVQQGAKLTKSSGAHAFQLKMKVRFIAKQKICLQFMIQKFVILGRFAFLGRRHLETKWVYKNKKDERGVVVRNKARLVAQEHRQEERVDYHEMDVKVPSLECSLWFTPSSQLPGMLLYLLSVDGGYRRGTIDKTLFIKNDKDDIMLVQVYVDDIIFGSTKRSLVTINNGRRREVKYRQSQEVLVDIPERITKRRVEFRNHSELRWELKYERGVQNQWELQGL
ncbi:putative reverse transcriptase domain-containing protein [Tanacetum coccineum]